jgi:hypothetical protein
MANTTSAKKAQRVAEKRRVFNARRKKAMKDAVKAVQNRQGRERRNYQGEHRGSHEIAHLEEGWRSHTLNSQYFLDKNPSLR